MKKNFQVTPLAMAVAAVLHGPYLMAQQSAPAETPKSADAPVMQEVVVSGSRIKRDNYSTPAPLQIIRNEDSVLAGFTSTTEVLQGTAVTSGQSQINNAYGGFVTEGGPGANTLGLRGFAPTRSLILLNGRRLSPSGTRGSVGASDLNTLPSSIVDRIEVLKDGSSSIYGSDAVAGVVNIITKTDLTGLIVNSALSFPADGGGEEKRFSLAGGLVKDRFRIAGSYEYYERKALTLADRDWTQCNTEYLRTSVNGVVGAWGSRDYIDPATGKPKCYPIGGPGSNGVTINTLGTQTTAGVPAIGAVGTTFNRWRPNSAVKTGLVGYEGVGGGANSLNVRDTFEPRMLEEDIISPTRNHNLFVYGGLDLPQFGDSELYYEFLYNRRDSKQSSYRQLSLDYTKGSPLIPSGLAFSTFSGPESGSRNMTNGLPIGVRAFIGFGLYASTQTVDFSRAVLGVRGPLARTGWEYDVSFTRSNSSGDYITPNWILDRMNRSADVVATASGFACKDPSNGCVPMPALSAAVIGGQLPAEWLNYVYRPVIGTTKFTEYVLTASATGTLFTLPHGKMRAAFGAEVRRNSIDDNPSPESKTNNLYGFSSSIETRGSDRARDLFGEIEIPVVRKMPGAEDLTVNLSSRWADYDSYGSDSTYKVGTLWSPQKWFTFRGTTGTSYRAPALFEQFLGTTSGFASSQSDPCNDWSSASRVGTARAANCKSEGLPEGFQQTASLTVLSSGGATAGLAAETSRNRTVGIVLQPALPSGWGDLSFAMDRFAVTVENGVSRLSTAAILSRCYDDPAFRSGGSFCRLVTRDSNTRLTVNNSYVNLATDQVKGLDYTARYSTNLGDGRLRVNLIATRFTQQAGKLFKEDPLEDGNGTIGSPEWTGTLDLNYAIKDWSFFYGLEWVSKMDSYAYLGQNPDTSIYKFSVPRYFTHSVSVKYKNPVGKWEAVVGVRNITDSSLPVISDGYYYRVGNAPLYSGYDYVGRTLFVNFTKSF